MLGYEDERTALAQRTGDACLVRVPAHGSAPRPADQSGADERERAQRARLRRALQPLPTRWAPRGASRPAPPAPPAAPAPPPRPPAVAQAPAAPPRPPQAAARTRGPGGVRRRRPRLHA